MRAGWSCCILLDFACRRITLACVPYVFAQTIARKVSDYSWFAQLVCTAHHVLDHSTGLLEDLKEYLVGEKSCAKANDLRGVEADVHA